MILCSCNCLSHRQVDQAIAEGATRPSEVYACCGKRPECGGCMRAIVAYMRAQIDSGAATVQA
jgi:bacterioferritin-associated ferredoxin